MTTWLPPFLAKYTNLQVLRNVDAFRYDNRGRSFIYGLYCHTADMIYIGSTWDSPRRFRQHLITGQRSNPYLQAAIALHGKKSFTLYVFEYVDTNKLPQAQRKPALLAAEQRFIAMVPTHKQYNLINAQT